MSVDQEIIIGAYIKVPTKKDKVTKQIHSCIVHGQKSLNKDFCNECNRTLNIHEIDEYFNVCISDITGNWELSEYISKDGYTYLFDDSNNLTLDLPDHNNISEIKDIDKKIKYFKIFHKTNIAELEEYYKQKLDVKFGIYNYVSY